MSYVRVSGFSIKHSPMNESLANSKRLAFRYCRDEGLRTQKPRGVWKVACRMAVEACPISKVGTLLMVGETRCLVRFREPSWVQLISVDLPSMSYGRRGAAETVQSSPWPRLALQRLLLPTSHDIISVLNIALTFGGPMPRRKYAWETLSDEQLLTRRLSSLRVTIEDTWLEDCV